MVLSVEVFADCNILNDTDRESKIFLKELVDNTYLCISECKSSVNLCVTEEGPGRGGGGGAGEGVEVSSGET